MATYGIMARFALKQVWVWRYKKMLYHSPFQQQKVGELLAAVKLIPLVNHSVATAAPPSGGSCQLRGWLATTKKILLQTQCPLGQCPEFIGH